MAFNQQQLQNAQIIRSVGEQMGMSERDIETAIVTALQESSLMNLNHGDGDSLGLFQQRPSQGWGSAQQIMNPQYAAQKFYNALKGVKNRGAMSIGQAAQAVQRSAYPGAYDTRLTQAQEVLKAIGGSGVPDATAMGSKGPSGGIQALPNATPGQAVVSALPNATPGEGKTATPLDSPNLLPELGPDGQPINKDINTAAKALSSPSDSQGDINMLSAADKTTGWDFNPVSQTDYTAALQKGNVDQNVGALSQVLGSTDFGKKITALAATYLGTPYVWGGTSPSGFDCSGLVQYIYKKAGIDLPRVSWQQASGGKRVSLNALQPGDLVAWDNSTRNNGADHIAIYVGNGMIIEAPRPGLAVRERKLGANEGAWGVTYQGGNNG